MLRMYIIIPRAITNKNNKNRAKNARAIKK